MGSNESMTEIIMNESNVEHHQAWDFGTKAVHEGVTLDPTSGAVIPPITLSTTFSHTAPGKPTGKYFYTRTSNPNRDDFQAAIAGLENARYGVAFSSGTAAVAMILLTLAKGSHIVSVADLYGGTKEFFTKIAVSHGIEISFTNNLDEELESLIRPNETQLVWIETPSNPTLQVVDIRKAANTAKKYEVKVVVDNTFLSPFIQTPIDLGCDIVLHSATKYINGHSDVLLGIIVLNDERIHGQLKYFQQAYGSVPSPFDCWLAHRGLKTLHLRVREASRNAQALAEMLANSTSVLSVYYPGLQSHENRGVVLKQHKEGMGGGVVSFRIKGGQRAAFSFTQHLKLFSLAVSLGGVESLVQLPTYMTHSSIPHEEREELGLYDDLLRLSCGVEGSDDLVQDVRQALEKTQL